MQTEITLEHLQNLLSEAYAVEVNDTLYYVGFDEDGNPYTADSDGQDMIEYDQVDGEIIYDDTHCSVFFYVGGDPVSIRFLQLNINPLKQ